MKTIITSKGDKTTSLFDTRFGRAEWFCLFDEDSGKISFVENNSMESVHGAGTRAVEQIVELGAGKVISGDFGPRAKELLEKFEIQMVVLQGEGRTIGEIIKKIK